MKMFKSPIISCLSALVLASITAAETSPEISYHIDLNNTGNLISNTEFSVTCVQCFAIGDLSLSGGDVDELIDFQPDSNFSSLPFNFDQVWLGAVVENLNAYIELEVLLTPTNFTNEINIPLLSTDGFTFTETIADIIDIEWNFDPVLHGWVNSSKPVNFTYAFEFEIPANSALFIPISNLSNISTIGFPSSTITPLNYSSPDPNDSFDFELSFRPIFRVSGTTPVSSKNLSAEAFVDVPKLDISVSQVTHVTRDCKPAPAGTPADQIFHNLTLVVPVLSFDFGFSATDIGSRVLQLGDNTTLQTSCLDFSTKDKALGPAPTSSSQPDSSNPPTSSNHPTPSGQSSDATGMLVLGRTSELVMGLGSIMAVFMGF